MRVILIMITLTSMVLLGCSHAAKSPGTPDFETNLPAQDVSVNAGNAHILAAGTMNILDESVELNRDLKAYLNVTQLVGSYFWFYIDEFIPPDTFRIYLNLHNASGITVWDVCVVFDELFGKVLLNPDSYTDILDPHDVNPFIAFMKEDPNRRFPPIVDHEQMLLQYPSGAEPYIDFYIVAHLGGNAGGVYEIPWVTQDEPLPPKDGLTALRAEVLDHQQDTSSVVALTQALTGGTTTFSLDGDLDHWKAAISNTEQLPIGIHSFLLKASSPASPQYSTYKYFDIEIAEIPTEFERYPIDILNDDVFSHTNTTSTGQHGIASRGSNFYLTFQGHSFTEGAIYFTKSTDNGATWSVSENITSETNGYRELSPSRNSTASYFPVDAPEGTLAIPRLSGV